MLRLRGRGRSRAGGRRAVSVLVVARVATRWRRVHVTSGRTSWRPVGIACWGASLVSIRGVALLGRRRGVIVARARRVVVGCGGASRVACAWGIS